MSRGYCDTCGEYASELHEGMCEPCIRKYLGHDKTDWSIPMHQAHIASLPTKELRIKALEDVPEQWRKRVEIHVKTVFALKKSNKNLAAKRANQ